MGRWGSLPFWRRSMGIRGVRGTFSGSLCNFSQACFQMLIPSCFCHFSASECSPSVPPFSLRMPPFQARLGPVLGLFWTPKSWISLGISSWSPLSSQHISTYARLGTNFSQACFQMLIPNCFCHFSASECPPSRLNLGQP